MPDNAEVLGFSNRWYRQALECAEPISLGDDLMIRVVSPPLFVATKLEAYKGRSNNDPLESHDLEDILNLVDGRPELLDEIRSVDAVLEDENFAYAVQNQARDPGREEVLFERLEMLAGKRR